MWTVRRIRTVGGYVVIAIGVTLMFVIGVTRAQTRTVTWQAVTTYTDNTPIASDVAITYSAWRQDNVTKATVQLADHVSATSVGFDDASLVKGRVYNFTAQAHALYLGGSTLSSEMSEVYPWSVPFPKAAPPRGLAVQ